MHSHVARRNSDDDNEISLKILQVFQVVVFKLKSELSEFPEILWTSVALLYSGSQREVKASLEFLQLAFLKFQVENQEGLEILNATLPPWKSFGGIQRILLKGLTSAMTADDTFKLFDRFMELGDCEAIESNHTRLLTLLLGTLPFLVSKLGDAETAVSSKKLADCIFTGRWMDHSWLSQGKILGNFLEKYSEGEYSSREDFAGDVCEIFSQIFFPDHQVYVLSVLYHVLKTGPSHLKQALLWMLRNFVRQINIPAKGPSLHELVFVLYQITFLSSEMLHTSYSPDASQLLEAISNISKDLQFSKLTSPLEKSQHDMMMEDGVPWKEKDFGKRLIARWLSQLYKSKPVSRSNSHQL
eukprot:TRINITY_DN2963_c1_g1_i1.p1 TRINITY_DN2963_c1_g1~~TRINITY_DN2963_c1_g1_i1.p1  ORF type:complete len:356 (+),score=120.56 TRINITY_DN2963_c1_g1_i1:183-1250(+)